MLLLNNFQNETPKVKVSNDNTYQWNNQQPDMNYVNPMNPAQQGGWPVQANQQWSNTQPIPQQILVQNNYEYVQPVVAQQNFYQVCHLILFWSDCGQASLKVKKLIT